MQSSRGRLVLVALFGALALGALTASAAQAVEAPRWSIGGKILEKESETHFMTAKIYTTKGIERFTLRSATGQEVSCLAVRLKEGSLLGSAAGNGGKNDEVIEFYGNCTVAGNGTNCSVREPIITEPVKSELVETEKAVPGTSGSLLMLFEPAVANGRFVSLHFFPLPGGTCIVELSAVAGKVAGQVLTDPENGTLGKLVELPKVNSAEANSWLINFPNPAIGRVGRIRGGVLTEENITLVAFGEPAVLTGTALLLLAKRNAKGELESEATKWGPRP